MFAGRGGGEQNVISKVRELPRWFKLRVLLQGDLPSMKI
jgi:hypothetical protein